MCKCELKKRKKRMRKYPDACKSFRFTGHGYDACVVCGARYGNPSTKVCGSATR